MNKKFLLLFLVLISSQSSGDVICYSGNNNSISNIDLNEIQNINNKFPGISFCTHRNDRFDTDFSFNKNGLLQSVENHKDGELHGQVTIWNEDGQKKFERSYKDGKKDGVWSWWFDNGQIESIKNYKAGKLDGEFTDWVKNGNMFSKGSYKNNQSHGLWTYWNNKNQKTEIREYDNGKLIYKTLFKYNAFNGKLKSKKKFINDVCVSGC